jgi:hypothetical protein
VACINSRHQKLHALTHDFVRFITENTIGSHAPLSYSPYFIWITRDHDARRITLIKA